MHESKVIESTVRRKAGEMVDEARKASDLLSGNCDREEAERIREALAFLSRAQEAMLEGFSSVLEGGRASTAGAGAGRDRAEADQGSARSDDSRRFDPMEMLGRGLERFDAETVGKGLDVLHGFVRMIDDLKRKGGTRRG